MAGRERSAQVRAARGILGLSRVARQVARDALLAPTSSISSDITARVADV